jgi:hypothetical protein
VSAPLGPSEPVRPDQPGIGTLPLAPIPPLGGALDAPDTTGAEFEARSAASYQAASPESSMIGVVDLDDGTTPIFDSISAWFATEPSHERAGEEQDTVIDLRDTPATVGAVPTAASAAAGGPGRWATLGDQRWLATNARAAAAPEIAGNTEAGLPRRQPGANLLPSAVEAAPVNRAGSAPSDVRAATAVPAPAPSSGPRPDADAVRGRLGSYQRGLTTARRARHLPGTGSTGQALGETESRPQDGGQGSADQGGNQ